MKRIVKILLFVLAMILLTACQQSEIRNGSTKTMKNSDNSYDCDRSTLHSFSAFAKTEDTVFFLNGYGRPDAILMYKDLQSGVSGPLCGRPECLHQDSDCNASVPWSVRAFSVYGDQLYYIRHNPQTQKDELISLGLDATRQRRIGEIKGNGYYNQSSNLMGTFHRGYAFFSGGESGIEDGKEYQKSTIVAYKLEDLDEEIMVYEGEKRFENGENVSIQPYGNQLYYIVSEHTEEAPESFETSVLKIYTWDLDNHEVKCLFSGVVDFSAYAFWVSDDLIYFSNPTDNRIISFSKDEGTFETAFYMGDQVPQNHLFCGNFANDAVIAITFEDEDQIRMVINDFSGEKLLDHTKKREKYENNGRFFLGSDEKAFYIHFLPTMAPEEVIVAVNRENGESTILVRSQR